MTALEKALGHWQRLAELGARFNQLPVPSNSIEPFSWSQLTPAVERDIDIARGTAKADKPPRPAPVGAPVQEARP